MTQSTRKRRAPARRRVTPDQFPGPIPWIWVRKAHSLSPSSLLVALGLWHCRHLFDNIVFTVGIRELAEFLGISYRTVQRTVHVLSGAGMIQVTRRLGGTHIFTIIEQLRGE
jgi:DNA-binding MarR family transcriptional regulator